MFRPNDRSFMQKVMDEEMDIFKTNYQQTMTQESLDQDFLNGNVLYRAVYFKQGVQDLLATGRVVTSTLKETVLHGVDNPKKNVERENGSFLRAAGNYNVSEGLFKNVTEQIIQEDAGMSWQNCIKEIESYRKLLGNNFYGAVLRSVEDKNIIINPYHILTTLSLLDEHAGSELSCAKFNIIVYVYKDREKMDAIYETELADPAKVEDSLTSLMSTYIDKIDTEYDVRELSDVSARGTCRVSYKIKKVDGEMVDREHMIVAHQVITRGIVAPYYGSSIIQMGQDGTKGTHIAPFRSANIYNVDGTTALRTTPEFNSVCTGSQNNATLTGLRTLTHSNLSSPYSVDIIATGALAYADAMIDMAASIFEQAGIISPDDGEEGIQDA